MTRTEELLDRFFRREGVRLSQIKGEIWIAAKGGCFEEAPGLVRANAGGKLVTINISDLARYLEEERACA